MYCAIPASIVIAILMVGLAAGYVICSIANREKKPLKNIGYLIGAIIIILSITLIARSAIVAVKKCRIHKMKKCSMMDREQPSIMPNMGAVSK